MIDREALRPVIEQSLHNAGPLAELADLSDLGAVHCMVLEMMIDRIDGMIEAGYSRTDVQAALASDVILARYART